MKKKRAGFAALLCTLLIVLDQITKALTVSVLKVHDIVVIPGVLTLTYVENRGAAFGIFQNKKIFFFLITAVMIAVFAYCYVRLLNQKSYRILRMLCVTYTAGALGKLIDRIVGALLKLNSNAVPLIRNTGLSRIYGHQSIIDSRLDSCLAFHNQISSFPGR